MRDILHRKFCIAARVLGFDPEPRHDPAIRPRQPVFHSFDGLRVDAVMASDGNHNRHIHRRQTLERLSAARKAVTVQPRKEEAAGAGTPAASDDRQP
jgi:hypothetical protein